MAYVGLPVKLVSTHVFFCNPAQGYINKTWGVPLTPKDQNDRLDEWSNGTAIIYLYM